MCQIPGAAKNLTVEIWLCLIEFPWIQLFRDQIPSDLIRWKFPAILLHRSGGLYALLAASEKCNWKNNHIRMSQTAKQSFLLCLTHQTWKRNLQEHIVFD